tara:strand:- start:3332 stop:3700 length:369 start_codon:yes stop_codon:yes gene_type:complete
MTPEQQHITLLVARLKVVNKRIEMLETWFSKVFELHMAQMQDEMNELREAVGVSANAHEFGDGLMVQIAGHLGLTDEPEPNYGDPRGHQYTGMLKQYTRWADGVGVLDAPREEATLDFGEED